MPVDRLVPLALEANQKTISPGGPQWPYVVIVIMLLFMWRGIEARSARRRQITFDEKKKTMIYKIGRRKNRQDGSRRPRTVALGCICAAHSGCLHCLIKMYVKRRDECAGEHLFINDRCGPISVRGLSSTFKEVGRRMKLEEMPTPHSARIAGSRHWATLGVSELSIAALGDWRSLRVLRDYVGAARLGEQISRELAITTAPATAPSQGHHVTLAAINELRRELSELKLAIKPPEDDGNQFAIVVRRKPRRWHLVSCRCHGPSDAWKTACGDFFNAKTMVLQRWSEFGGDDVRCSTCK
jgi:hypothetical protein